MTSRARKLAALALSVVPSRLKPRLYRLLGAKIGKDVKIGFGSVIVADKLDLGDGTRIGALNYINVGELSTGSFARVGNLSRVMVAKLDLRSRAIVDSRVEIVGDKREVERSVITLGKHSWLFPHSYVNVSRPVTLGKNVGVGGGSYIFTHGYWLSALDGFPVKYGAVTIGDDAWLPWSCFVMPGVDIGPRVVVGARSLINKDVPADALVAGSPAKVIRDRSSRDVPLDEKLDLLEALTREHAQYQGASFERAETRQGGRILVVGGRRLVALHASRVAEADLEVDALNVLPGALDVELASARPCLFLDGYGSSSDARLSCDVKAWLGFARRIGLRFYPWDEA